MRSPDAARREQRSRLATSPGGKRRQGFLIWVGATTFVAGAAILAISLAPMWGVGPNTATVAPPPAAQSSSAEDIAAQRAAEAATSALDRPVNGVAFTMQVPALQYNATVVEGVDTAALDKGPGHYPTTAWPGHAGIVGIAAHNVYWLGFSRLEPGDQVEITTRRATFVYEVTAIKITDPNDRTVLVPSPDYRLVLTTCYPLWAGVLATQRLVFFARQTGTR
jgi:sortase A